MAQTRAEAQPSLGLWARLHTHTQLSPVSRLPHPCPGQRGSCLLNCPLPQTAPRKPAPLPTGSPTEGDDKAFHAGAHRASLHLLATLPSFSSWPRRNTASATCSPNLSHLLTMTPWPHFRWASLQPSPTLCHSAATTSQGLAVSGGRMQWGGLSQSGSASGRPRGHPTGICAPELKMHKGGWSGQRPWRHKL